MIKQKKIAIIGVGLIGGSIAVGLKKRLGDKVSILGACSSFKRAIEAQKQGILDAALLDPHIVPDDVDLIILAAPISENIKLLKSLKSPKALVIDVGSAKETIYQSLPPKLRFIGTHPMAGGELAGFEFSNPDLFLNKPWIVCSGVHTNAKDMQTIESLIETLDANIIHMSPKRHDELVSLISHLPIVVAETLLKTATKSDSWEEANRIASSGFADMTRLAHHNEKLKQDIIRTNRENIIKNLHVFRDEINLLINKLES